mmetsp:Transcript_23540/g.56281  ORF Transcript_23540/g.56281 Transcript_23540/m.56281 type:complete len:297 (+) Transcript_23540:261-1151(+)
MYTPRYFKKVSTRSPLEAPFSGKSLNCHATPCTKTATTRCHSLECFGGSLSVTWYSTGALRSTVRLIDSSGARCTPSALHCSAVLKAPSSRKLRALNMLILALEAAGTRTMGTRLRSALGPARLLLAAACEDEECLWLLPCVARGGGGGGGGAAAAALCLPLPLGSKPGGTLGTGLRSSARSCRWRLGCWRPYGLMPSLSISFAMAECCMSDRSKRPDGLMGSCGAASGFAEEEEGVCRCGCLGCSREEVLLRLWVWAFSLPRSDLLARSRTLLRSLFGVVSCELRSRSSRSRLMI